MPDEDDYRAQLSDEELAIYATLPCPQPARLSSLQMARLHRHAARVAQSIAEQPTLPAPKANTRAG